MKKLLLIALLIPAMGSSQLLYNWYPANPGWTASNPNGTHINYQPTIPTAAPGGTVSTNGANVGYTNNRNSTYTSGAVSYSCGVSQYVQVNITLDVDLENRFDWLYFQYSTDGGTTWINPVAQYPQTNQSGKNLSAFGLGTNNRNGFTGLMGIINRAYIIPETVNRFRWVFATDNTVNSWFGGYYYVDILSFSVSCVALLPVELISFNGRPDGTGNILEWSTATETDNDYFTIERSADGISWETIGTIVGTGTSNVTNNYTYTDKSPDNSIVYYRLSQTDFNGNVTDHGIISVQRPTEESPLKYINILGQEVPEEKADFIVFPSGKVERIKIKIQ